jgi:hypothetical protein
MDYFDFFEYDRDIYISHMLIFLLGYGIWRHICFSKFGTRVRGRSDTKSVKWFNPRLRGRTNPHRSTQIEWPTRIILFLLLCVITFIGQPSIQTGRQGYRTCGSRRNFRLRYRRFRNNKKNLLTSSQDGKGTIHSHAQPYVPMTATDHMAARDNALLGTPLNYHYDNMHVLSTIEGPRV